MAIRLVRLCALVFLLLPWGVADAQTAAPAPESKKRAERLFAAARKLMQQPGKLAEACRKFAESYDLMKRGDTKLNLAECHRRQGKTATAWREFNEAINYAREVEFSDAIEIAKQLRDELATQLSYLTVKVAAETSKLGGLTITLNGAPLSQKKWNRPVLLDPGPYQVGAKATGHKPFSVTVQLETKADKKQVVVTLEPLPSTTPQPVPTQPPAPDDAAQTGTPVWVWITGGIGLALIGTAIGLGADSLNASSELDEQCGEDRVACPTDYDYEPVRDREMRGFGIYVGFGAAGLIAVGVAVAGLVASGSNDSDAAQTKPFTVAPWVSTDSGGIAIRASF